MLKRLFQGKLVLCSRLVREFHLLHPPPKFAFCGFGLVFELEDALICIGDFLAKVGECLKDDFEVALQPDLREADDVDEGDLLQLAKGVAHNNYGRTVEGHSQNVILV